MTDSPLKCITDHRDSGGAALRARGRAEDLKRNLQLSTKNDMTRPFEKGSIKDINVTASSGTVNFVHADNADKIEVIGVKNTQMTSTSPADHLPEQWNVPPRNSNFIGRSKLLKQIEDHFSQKTNPAVLTACHGLGEIGKTQVALEFVWQHYKKYNGVVWFNAESQDQLQNEYIILGREKNIIRDDDNISAKELTRKV